jgi:hypothetical protein
MVHILLSRNFEEIPLQLPHRTCGYLQQKDRPWMAYLIFSSDIGHPAIYWARDSLALLLEE